MTNKTASFATGVFVSALLHVMIFVGMLFSRSSETNSLQTFNVDINTVSPAPLARGDSTAHQIKPVVAHKKVAQTLQPSLTKETSTKSASEDETADDKQTSENSGVSAGFPSGNGGSQGNALGVYASQIIQILNQKKIYPKVSVDREEEGTVVISVQLAANGAVEKIEVIKSAIFDRLNSAALQTIHAIPRFPPPPLQKGAEHFTMEIPLTYKIDRH